MFLFSKRSHWHRVHIWALPWTSDLVNILIFKLIQPESCHGDMKQAFVIISPMSIRHELSHQISQGIISNRLYHCNANMLDCQTQQQSEASYLIEEHMFLISRSSFHSQLLKQGSHSGFNPCMPALVNTKNCHELDLALAYRFLQKHRHFINLSLNALQYSVLGLV